MLWLWLWLLLWVLLLQLGSVGVAGGVAVVEGGRVVVWMLGAGAGCLEAGSRCGRLQVVWLGWGLCCLVELVCSCRV